VPAVGQQRQRVRQDAACHGRRQQRDVDRERRAHPAPVAGPARVEMLVRMVVVRHAASA
jgi:hypothetical protein